MHCSYRHYGTLFLCSETCFVSRANTGKRAPTPAESDSSEMDSDSMKSQSSEEPMRKKRERQRKLRRKVQERVSGLTMQPSQISGSQSRKGKGVRKKEVMSRRVH